MTAVEFGVLGELEVRRDGRAVALRGARLRRLLAILLVRPNVVVPADRIADELWSGEPPPTATTALHVLVSRLRQAVEPDRPARSTGGVVETVPPGYRVRVDRNQVDALRFEDAVAAAREAMAAGRCDEAAAGLDTALGLWRGPALSEFAGEPFAEAAAAGWAELRAEAEEDRIDALLALGRSGEVLPRLEAMVDAEPFRERRTAQLMLALYRAGRQADALRAYERLRRRLADELGLVPGPDVRKLEHAILLQDPTLARTGAAAATLVGRDAELGALRTALGRAAAGRAQVVLVAGEPGIGKTSVVAAFVAEARSRGVAVWQGGGAEGVGAGPYRPWVDVLAAAAADGRPVDGEALAPLRGGRAAATGLGPGAARLRLFEAVCDLLRSAAADRPLAVVLDDLQWADVPSLRLLEAVAGGLGEARVLVVAAYREAAALGDHPVAATVDQLAGSPHTTVVQLGRLPADAVAAMVEAMTGQRAEALAGLVHERTGGNPLFVRELVRLLAAAGSLDDLAAGAAGAAGVPRTVRSMVARTFGRLSPDGREVVAAAAVAGREVEADRLRAVADCSEVRCTAGLRDAMGAGLLVEEAAAPDRFRFSHDLVRESVYDELSAMRRARLHRLTGEALEEAARRGVAAVSAADLAHHFVAAARTGGDPAKAVHYAALAAEEATAALAYEEAVAQYERAVEAGPGVDPGDRACLLLALGDARWRAGDVVAARETFLEAVHEARRLDRADLLVQAVLGFSGGYFRAWHATRGAFGNRPVALLEEALAAVGTADSTARVRLLGLLAEELYYSDDDRRFSLSEEAVAMARRLGDRETLAAALSSRCLAVWGPDHVHERRAAAAEVVAIADATGHRELALFGRRCRFVAELELGDTAAADATLDEFEAGAEELRQLLYRWEARWFRAMQAMFRGRFEDAERLAVEAFELGQRTEDPDALAIFGVQLGVLRLEQGRTAEVDEGIRALAAEFPESPAWRAALCLAAADLGRTDEARAELDGLGADRFASLPKDFAYLAALAMLAEACHLVDAPDHAEALRELLVPYADRNVTTADRNCWGSAAHYLGRLAATLGRWEEAVEWFERALAANERMGAVPWAAHSREGLAGALWARDHPGDRERAGVLLAAAEATAAHLGMARLARSLARAD